MMSTGTECPGATMWLTGLPGAGKSTLAQAVSKRLIECGHRVEVLDGDDLRASISSELGFSPHDRDMHVRRVGFVARLLASHGVIAIVPVIAPYANARRAVRQQHQDCSCPYFEVYLATPVSECMRRDPKGLYARAAAGTLSGLTGFDATYEEPVNPELHLDTTDLDIPAARDAVLALLGESAALGAPLTTGGRR